MRFCTTKRKLFGIGYAVGGPVEFTSHYDLLASECRAREPGRHRQRRRAGRTLVRAGPPARAIAPDGQTLLSWSGTMFEYLMPLLFTRTFDNSLLDNACRDAVAEQIEYGKGEECPLGHFRIRLQRPRRQSDLSVPRLRRSRSWR